MENVNRFFFLLKKTHACIYVHENGLHLFYYL